MSNTAPYRPNNRYNAGNFTSDIFTPVFQISDHSGAKRQSTTWYRAKLVRNNIRKTIIPEMYVIIQEFLTPQNKILHKVIKETVLRTRKHKVVAIVTTESAAMHLARIIKKEFRDIAVRNEQVHYDCTIPAVN